MFDEFSVGLKASPGVPESLLKEKKLFVLKKPWSGSGSGVSENGLNTA
jgi:hypothetical protein